MKAAIITGASVGIGRATAEAFLAEDYQVFNLSRRACPADGVNNIACDLASDTAVAATCASLATAINGCTTVALVHNASQMRKDSAHCRILPKLPRQPCVSTAVRIVVDPIEIPLSYHRQGPVFPS